MQALVDNVRSTTVRMAGKTITFARTGSRIAVLILAIGSAAACKDSPTSPSEEPPVVTSIPAAEAPAQRPADLTTSCYAGPDNFTAAPCPVVRWNGITYWAHSYIDNRLSFAVVGYDASGNVVGQVEAPGGRYVWRITVDETARTITIAGQANGSATLAWSDLPGAGN